LSQYVAPAPNLNGFNCPHCQAFAHQQWFYVYINTSANGRPVKDIHLCYCRRCNEYSIWYKEKMVVPNSGTAPPPHPDLPEDIKEDYKEAMSIVSLSSRSAAALLRLAIQKLTNKLLGNDRKENLSDNIGLLVKRGLHQEIQKALDIVRVIGNNAVHPGQIDLKDNPETAAKLFALINIITEEMITKPKEIAALYDKLPDTDKQKIAKRNGNEKSSKGEIIALILTAVWVIIIIASVYKAYP
jgi:hypothetical protein